MLELKDLQVEYGNTKVLNSISLEIEEGEKVGIIGESGAGKTTLGLSVMGLTQGEVGGQIIFKGQNLLAAKQQDWAELRWQQIAMVMQNVDNILNPGYTILSQVAEPIIQHENLTKSEAIFRAERLLKQTGLTRAKMKLYPDSLSGGERARALIAMALANDPEFIIFDEPTAALDFLTKEKIATLIKEVSKEKTTLIISHDFFLLKELVDKIAVLYQGKIVELAETEEILQKPTHPYTRALIRSYPTMHRTQELQGVRRGNKEHAGKGCPFYARCTQSLDLCALKEPQLQKMEPAQRFLACHRDGIVEVIRTRGLTKEYTQDGLFTKDSFKAVNEVDLSIKEGEIVSLVGESGSGKSTLAKSIAGLTPHSEGEIIFKGESLANWKQKALEFHSQVQMIWQDPASSFNSKLSILEILIEPLQIQGIKDKEIRLKKAKKVLREVYLPEDESFLSSESTSLSGGELQRLAIARALVLEPKLLIADEPTSALDPGVQAQVLKLLLELQNQEGLAMLFITHDIALARKVSDRILVMYEGKIVERGNAVRVINRPQHSYTKRLLTAANSF
ncbi:ABC transporter ATP-binding protein [Fuchsiella alkaliacetigena]|uniref:ABC transporter ATP-binding protein n=1 Tax=Fuchsiella alkaliacetigena TaxID=957042 RepID=UPI00200B6380|nr:ABC transporter ATP-binding protein [Fuchsiella alkaliacetigena]MCK8824632.1 ABC transporter ATP-binding protein [Fuchsiella alkaliacetigena]